MTYAVLAVTGLISLIAFAWQLVIRRRSANWLSDFTSVSLMIGFTGVGILHLIVQPDLNATVDFFLYYAPHAYNLLIWPVLALVLLRRRFGGGSFFLAFVFAYGVDEMLWNSIAYVRFDGSTSVMRYLTTQDWQFFFAVVVVVVALSYYLLRPRIVPNWGWVLFSAYIFVYAYVAGLPTYIDAGASPDWYIWMWELMWQVAYWIFVYFTLWPRGATWRVSEAARLRLN